jgi:hypothetical protein
VATNQEQIKKPETLSDLMNLAREINPTAEVEVDCDGQLLIYTGFKLEDGKIVGFEPK